MRSIYMEKQWGVLQEEMEKGKSNTYTFSSGGTTILYPFIQRTAGIVNDVQYFDIVTPRGVCGPWIEGAPSPEQISDFWDDLSEYCMREHIIAEYIRFAPWQKTPNPIERMYNSHFHGYLYCNDLTTDFFAGEYSETRRRNIRKAQKSGVKIAFTQHPAAIDPFLLLYEFTKQKHAIGEYYLLTRSFLEKYFAFFPNQTLFAQAEYEGKIISSAMILLGGDIAHYHYAASHPDYVSLQANSLLIYEASVYAAQLGKRLFDLGGAASGSSLENYKRNFTRNAKQYPYRYGTIVRNQPVYDELVKRRGGARENYFPAYR